jgi:hypothetical protein
VDECILPIAEDPEIIIIAKVFDRDFSHIELVELIELASTVQTWTISSYILGMM